MFININILKLSYILSLLLDTQYKMDLSNMDTEQDISIVKAGSMDYIGYSMRLFMNSSKDVETHERCPLQHNHSEEQVYQLLLNYYLIYLEKILIKKNLKDFYRQKMELLKHHFIDHQKHH